MKTQFGFIDPGAIMGAVVALIVLGVGVFAFFVTSVNLTGSFPGGAADSYQNYSRFSYWNAINNSTTTGNSVFNIVGIVLIIGAIMAIVGLVYNYVR